MRAPAVLIIFLGLAACAITPAYRIKVDSLAARPPSAGETYTLLPVDGRTSDLQFQEYASYVKAALADLGYEFVEDANRATLLVDLDYGVGEPQQQIYSYDVPRSGYMRPWYRHGPVIGYGYSTRVDSYTTYARYLGLFAYSNQRGERGEQAWRTVVVSRGSSEDLRRLFPAMLAAAKPYIGRDTGGQVEIVMPEDDAALLELKAAASARS